jgi:hypothetical protein
MVVSRRRASASCSCSWSPARASSARTARHPPLWQDMQGPWRAPAMNVGTTPAEVRGIKKLDDGRRMPRLVYGLVYKGLGAIVRHTRLPRLSCKSGENKRADERTRTADLLIASKPLPHSLLLVNTAFCRSFSGTVVRTITPNIALYRPYCCHYCCHRQVFESVDQQIINLPPIGPPHLRRKAYLHESSCGRMALTPSCTWRRRHANPWPKERLQRRVRARGRTNRQPLRLGNPRYLRTITGFVL